MNALFCRPILALVCPALLLCLAGCQGDSAVVDVPNPDRIERKSFDEMTKEEKIQFIQRTPMSEEAKAKQIEMINAGTL